jgi:predicted PurR-regulated permease PerM
VNRGTYFALLLFGTVVATLWAAGLLLRPFAVPIAWAICLVTVTGGLYRRLARWTGKPRLSSLLMTLLTALGLVVPIALIGVAVAREAAGMLQRAREARAAEGPVEGEGTSAPAPGPGPAREAEGEGDADPARPPAAATDAWDRFLADHPKLDALRQRVDGWLSKVGTDTRKLRDAALRNLSGAFAGGAVSFARDAFLAGFAFVMMLATLYFLYRDGQKMRDVVVDVVPLAPAETNRVLDTLRATIFAALVGGVLTAVIQGALGGIALAITGISTAVLWGVFMALLSLLPFGGAALVWLPVAIYFFATGRTWQAWFLAAWGVLVVGLADNLFRPWIMRKAGAGDIHPLLLFFAILSGIGIFGISGIVFGPLLMAIVLGLLRVYREHVGGPATAERPPTIETA